MSLTPAEEKLLAKLIAKKEKPILLKKDVLNRIQEKLGKERGCVPILDSKGHVIVYSIPDYLKLVAHGKKLGNGELTRKGQQGDLGLTPAVQA